MAQITFFRQYAPLLICTLSISLLVGCASAPKPEQPKQVVTEKPDVVAPVIEPSSSTSALDYLALAKQADENQAITYLVYASEQYLNEDNADNAFWLASQVRQLIAAQRAQAELNESDTLKLNREMHLYRLALVQADVLVQSEQFSLAQQHMQDAAGIAHEQQLEHLPLFYQLQQQVSLNNQLAVAAIDAQLHLFALDESSNQEQIGAIWLALGQLSQWQLQQLVKLNPPHIKGWQRLLSYGNRFGDDNAQFASYLTQWQRQFPTHPANAIIESLAPQSSEAELRVEKIAVLLPLSGKQQAAGLAAQQGMLAAFERNQTSELVFFDTNTLDLTTLAASLEEQEIEAIIGPLLKNNVQALLNQQDITLPTLLLNIPIEGKLQDHQFAISMRPEEEALQAATALSNKHFKHPLVISHEDTVSQRITLTFVKQWQNTTGTKPEVIYFKQDASMQNTLKASLDVKQSQDRISDFNARIKKTIKTQTRNRRDIDMIYLVGSPLQTRLMKPYIDVNIAPFADIIPVYASSRSHSVNMAANDSRDLDGLTFTEMPWLLPNQQRDSQLAKEASILWPQRSDSLQRIFAMGYDSIQLVNKVGIMRLAPYVQHFGQTGVLKMNEHNVLTRSLYWGKYRKDKVTSIELD